MWRLTTLGACGSKVLNVNQIAIDACVIFEVDVIIVTGWRGAFWV
jgi:hypothetical protein